MADYTATVSLSDVKLGDRWVGISEILPTVNDSTPDDALTRVVMNFRLGNLTYTLDSDDGEITIENAAAWLCSIPARDDFLPRAGKWQWQMRFYFGTDSVWTLYKGTLTVHDDV